MLRLLCAALLALLLGGLSAAPGSASGTGSTSGVGTQSAQGAQGRSWADADAARIHPGVQMYTQGAQCTGNFVFTDGAGRVYVGYAAHCAGRGEATDTNGCDTRSHPIGTRVRFAHGGTLVSAGTTVGRGTLVYSSWVTMRDRSEPDRDACEANDFALVRVDADDVRKVNPSVPFWGGPTGLSRTGAPAGTTVYSWGQSSLRPTTVLSPRTGTSLGRTDGGWGWEVYTATPGILGDSGSGFLDEEGRALGTLSTVGITPYPAANGLGDLESELRYAERYGPFDGLRLVPGTEPFSPVP